MPTDPDRPIMTVALASRTSVTQRRGFGIGILLCSLVLLLTRLPGVTSFTVTSLTNPSRGAFGVGTASFRKGVPLRPASTTTTSPTTTTASSPTALHVWWFGGTAEAERTASDDSSSCELVAVRIEKTSSNSRRIFGEIVVEGRLADVWAILTDYNRLSIHVPNLVESRVVSVETPQAQPGDGSYRCRLFQKGAQKIVGFEFGASVTMDMAERYYEGAPHLPPASSDESFLPQRTEERGIAFKCYDSFFFSEFDGEWKASERWDAVTQQFETVLSYVVDVRPRGPVPVAALEWRIREDVPTNLRAVKQAALGRQAAASSPLSTVSQASTATVPAVRIDHNHSSGRTVNRSGRTKPATTPVSASASKPRSKRSPPIMPSYGGMPLTPRQQQGVWRERQAKQQGATPVSRQSSSASSQNQPQGLSKVKVDWDDNETLGAYLKRP